MTAIEAMPGTAACPLSEVPEGIFKIVEVGGVEIGLTRSGDRVHAVRNVCPHMHAPICRGRVMGTMLPSGPGDFVFGLEEQVVVCPWHQWEFNLDTGKPLFTNAKGRLRTYPVEVHDGVVHVGVGRRAAELGTQAP